MNINKLAKTIRCVNTNNGWNLVNRQDWYDGYKIPAVIALIHSELSEALEGFRHNDEDNFIEEIADVLIRTLDLAGGITSDFEKVVMKKIEKNKHRGYKHGGKRI